MDVKEQLKDIKTQLRLSMNGVVSQSMREKGLDYKLNFGVELPRIKSIAAAYEKSHDLAQALWKENIRECKILAGLLQPIDTFFPEIADIWVEDIRNIEIAELTCMNLFQNLPYAPAKTFQWIADEAEYTQVCGYLTIARLLMKKGDMAQRPAGELLDQAICAVQSGSYHVRNAAMLAIRKYMQHSEEHAFQVCRLVEGMENSEKEAEQTAKPMIRVFYPKLWMICRNQSMRRKEIWKLPDSFQKQSYSRNCPTRNCRKISCGDVVVYCDSKSAHLGDYMKACGRIGLFKSATNEGEFDRAGFYRSQGIDFSVKADNIKTSTGKHAWYYHRLEKLRDTLSASLLKVTDETTAGVLSSMLLGDKSYLDDEIKDLYQISGISHILAISGVKTLKLDIPLVPETRINWAFVPLHIAIIYILKLCLDEEIIPRCRFPCSRGYHKKYINCQKKQ